MTGAGFGYASMLILENAHRPALTSTRRPTRTMARRESATARSPLSTPCLSPRSRAAASIRGSRRCQDVTEEQGRLRGHQLSSVKPLEDLREPVVLQAELDRPLHQSLAVDRDPRRHRAVALPQYRPRGNTRRSRGDPGHDAKAREHVGLELAVGIGDLGTDELTRADLAGRHGSGDRGHDLRHAIDVMRGLDLRDLRVALAEGRSEAVPG